MTDAAVKTNVMPLILAAETSGRLGSIALAEGPQLLGVQSFTGQTRLGVGAAVAKEANGMPSRSRTRLGEGVNEAAEAIETPSRSRMRHSAELFPAIISLLDRFGKKPNQIEQVYISIGPGSFTGLRIAVTLAKTMALANQAKIVAVDTLDCIAANVVNLACPLNAERCPLLGPSERLAAILDAKRSQFFIAVYEKAHDALRATHNAIWQKILPDCLMTAEEFLDKFAGCGKPIALLGEGLVYYKDKFISPAIRLLDEKYWNPSAEKVHELGWRKAQKGEFADPIALIPNYLRQPDVKLKKT
jgi:tRNA threonylcarbamoyladenosine biosynthesis protein TsaB